MGIKHKKQESILVIQKYKSSKIGVISMIITLLVSLTLYAIIICLLHNDKIDNTYYAVICVGRDILLAVISIIGTSLLTSVFIEKNRKNIDYTELIANDIFASSEFYTNLTIENKYKISQYLEENLYKKTPIKNELIQLCRNNIDSDEIKYYMTDLNMAISYFDYNEYTEKNIKRIIKLRAYGEDYETDKLFLFSYNLSPTEHVQNFEVKSAGIGISNESLIIGKDILVEKCDTKDPLFNKSGYTDTYNVYLCRHTKVTSSYDTIINIEYIARVTDGDISSKYGVTVPCKNFNFNFVAPENYTVYAHPATFFTTDNNYTNSLYKNAVSICLNNWVFPGEGVIVCVVKNNRNSPCSNNIINKMPISV